MDEDQTPHTLEHKFSSAGADKAMAWLGVIVGYTPVLAGLFFRTYTYSVAPAATELLRQLDVPFILIEIIVIVWAHGRGLRFDAIVARLDRPAKWAFAIFAGSFWVSSVFLSEQPGYSVIRASFWPVHIAFALAVFHLAREASQTGLAWFAAGVCTGFLTFLPLLATHFLAAPEASWVPDGKVIWSSAIPGCLSVRHLGIWSALVLACAVGVLYMEPLATRYRLLACAMIFATTATLFWSGTRAGVYGMAGACLVLFFTVRRLPPGRFVVLAAVASVLGVLVSTLWLPPDGSFGMFARDAVPDADLDTFANGRLGLWVGMLKAFIAAPLFGVGEGAVLWLVPVTNGGHHVQPHNSLVQILSSWGMIAATAATYLVARLLVTAHRAARLDSNLIFMTLLMDCLLIMSLVDGVLYFSRFVMFFAACAAIVVAHYHRQWRTNAAGKPHSAALVAASSI